MARSLRSDRDYLRLPPGIRTVLISDSTVTIPVRIGLGERAPAAGLPEVTGGNDARRAGWVPAACYGLLANALAELYGGTVFTAHVGMLREFLGGGLRPSPSPAYRTRSC